MSYRKSITSLSDYGPKALVDGAEVLSDRINNKQDSQTAVRRPSLKERIARIVPGQKKVTYQTYLTELSYLSPGQALDALRLLTEEFFAHGKPIHDRDNRFDQLIAVFSKLPADSEIYHNALSTMINQFWLDLPRPPTMFANDTFRSADGSGTSLLYPWLGKAGSSYARTVTSRRLVDYSKLPDPGLIFDKILDRANTPAFKPHPGGMNTVIFYFATLITHDLFRTDPTNILKNNATGYADLSPIYGASADEQKSVRTYKQGLLKPDAFADPRLVFQPPGVPALVVLFRCHGRVAAV